MGCSASSEADLNMVSISRERMRLIKLAVQCRDALSIAHCNYYQSLNAVAKAIKLSVARHSSLPSLSPIASPQSSDSAAVGKDIEKEDEDSSQKVSGWDFFNLLSGDRTEDDPRAVREAEGIPELEEEGVSENGRELLEALKDVEEHFVKAYEYGGEVSRMLETNMNHLQSPGFEKIQDCPNKNVQQPITRRGSSSSQSSYGKSLLSFSSRRSSKWTEFKNDPFGEHGGMNSGSHSLTLERLYIWEEKLYKEVKAGDQARKIYKQKRIQLRNQESKGKGQESVNKTRAEVEEINSSIRVAIESVKSLSQITKKLRDEELHPQLVELLHGLMRTWKTMLELHETQKRAMFEVKSFTCPAYKKFCNGSHHLATLQLQEKLQNWHACFDEYVSAQKAYVKALDGWLSKFNGQEVDFVSRGSRPSLVLPSQTNGPPVFVICHGWLTSLEKLPDKSVMHAMGNFEKCIQEMRAQQGEEQQQKRKVGRLKKKLDKKVIELKRVEENFLESKSKLSGQKTEVDVGRQAEYLAERKCQLDMLRKRLNAEKAKHRESMKETKQITLRGFQVGFSKVFESLMEFSKASLKMYADLVVKSEDGKVGNEKGEPSSKQGQGPNSSQ